MDRHERSLSLVALLSLVLVGSVSFGIADTRTMAAPPDLVTLGITTIQQQDIPNGFRAPLLSSTGATVATLTAVKDATGATTCTWSEYGADVLQITVMEGGRKYRIVDVTTGDVGSASYDEQQNAWMTSGPLAQILQRHQSRMNSVGQTIDFLVLGVSFYLSRKGPYHPSEVDPADGPLGGGPIWKWCTGRICTGAGFSMTRSDACRSAKAAANDCCLTGSCLGCCEPPTVCDCGCAIPTTDFLCGCGTTGQACNR